MSVVKFLQSIKQKYNAKNVPGSSQGREGKGYDWPIKFSETELVAEGNFSRSLFVKEEEEEKERSRFFMRRKGVHRYYSVHYLSERIKNT